MKKIIFIIFCNLLLILIFLGILEFSLYKSYTKKHPEIKYQIKEVKYDNILNYYTLRPPVGLEYNKQPIILAGCSFAYGQGLTDEQTFGYKLAHYTQRPIYNISLPGKGLQHNLFFIQNNMFDNTIKSPEYFIYVIMSDQIRRLYTTVCMHDYTAYPQYVLNNENKLILKSKKYPFYKQFYTYYFFNNIYYSYFDYKNYSKHTKLVKEYFREMKSSLREIYPDAKFVVLFYGDYDKYYHLSLDDLEKEGFIFIHTQDLSDINIFDDEYHLSKDDFHPTEKAWDIITPAFAKKLKL